jgi:hypothetical protein
MSSGMGFALVLVFYFVGGYFGNYARNYASGTVRSISHPFLRGLVDSLVYSVVTVFVVALLAKVFYMGVPFFGAVILLTVIDMVLKNRNY